MSSGAGEKGDFDEGLIITAVCRMLGAAVGRKKKGPKDPGDEPGVKRSGYPYGLVCASLDVLSSICDRASDGMVPSLPGDTTCASVEADMIGSIGPPLLEALCENVLRFYHEQRDGGHEALEGLTGCFGAAASVVSLLETRLARADGTLRGLRDAAWLVLNNIHALLGRDDEVLSLQRAVTTMLSTLVLAGNSEGALPSVLWSREVLNGAMLLRWAIHDFFPVPSADGSADGKGNGSDGVREESRKHPEAWKLHECWKSIATEPLPGGRETDELDLGSDCTDVHRSRALESRISCLTGYICSLLRMDGHPLHQSNSFSSPPSVPLDSLLDVAEVLLSFPLAAEARYRSTKSRLRSTPVSDGLISPNTAIDVASSVRLCGHYLLDAAVGSCRGGSGALGRARRLVSISVANLQSSCSSALVSVVDGRRGVIKEGGAGSRLRGSIPLRTKSVRTFHAVAVALGSGIMSSSGTTRSASRAMVLLAGCLLEQVQAGGDGEGSAGLDSDGWGTLGERAKLV